MSALKSFEQAIQGGLRKSILLPPNAMAFSRYKNLRPTEYGARRFHDILQIIDDDYIENTLGKTKDWPFPQMFFGRKISLLCFSDALYEIDTSSFTASPIVLYNAHEIESASPSESHIPEGGGAWHFADFHDTWMLFNGACCIFKTLHHDKVWVTGLDEESLSNNDFSGSASGWTLGGNWVYDSDGIVHTAGVPSSAYQLSSSQVVGKEIVMQRRYRVEVEISGSIGSGVIQIYTTGGIHIHTINPPFNGIHVFDAVFKGTTFSIFANTHFSGKIERVSCKKLPATIETGANWMDGRVVFAGFNGDDCYNMADWPSELASYQGKAPDELEAMINAWGRSGLGQNWVYVSSINGDDLFRFWSMKLMRFGSFADTPNMGYSEGNPYWLMLAGRNEFCKIPMPWGGKCCRAIQLGNSMVIYGTTGEKNERGGVSALYPNDEKIGLADVSGIGHGVCPMGRGAVDGGQDMHMMVGMDGGLYRIGSDGGRVVAEHLDYREYLSELDPETTVVTRDPRNNEFYIADAETEYLFSENGGLCRPPWKPTAISFYGIAASSILFDSDDPDSIDLVTQPFDAALFEGKSGQAFNINRIRIVTTDIDADGWTAIVEYRLRNDKAFRSSDIRHFSGSGVAECNIPATMARIRLMHPDRLKTDGIAGLYVEASISGIFSSAEVLIAAPAGPATID